MPHFFYLAARYACSCPLLSLSLFLSLVPHDMRRSIVYDIPPFFLLCNSAGSEYVPPWDVFVLLLFHVFPSLLLLPRRFFAALAFPVDCSPATPMISLPPPPPPTF